MAVHGRYTRLLVDQFDFSGDNNGLTFSVATDNEDVTCFQATGKEYATFDPAFTLEQAGYWKIGSGLTGGQEDELFDRIESGTATVVALFDTETAACPAYVLPNTGTGGITLGAPATGVITMTGTWYGNQGCYRGRRIFTGSIAATGAQTAYDFGAAGSAGGKAYLFIQSITGSATNATIDIESCATESGSYASEGTFTFSAVGVQVVTMSGTVNRWLRLNCTDKGGATSFVVVGIAAVSGVTYSIA